MHFRINSKALFLCSIPFFSSFAKKEFQIRHFEELATALLLQATGENKIDLCTTSTLFPLCSSTKRENKMKEYRKNLNEGYQKNPSQLQISSSFLKIQFTNTQKPSFFVASLSDRKLSVWQVRQGQVFFVIHVFCNAKEGCEWVVVAFSFHMKNCCKQDSDRWV